MARVLVVYHRVPESEWLPTYEQSVRSLQRYSRHSVYFLNTARLTLPQYLLSMKPDLVVFHYTFLLLRQSDEEWERIQDLVRFTCYLRAPRIIIAQDEQVRMDRLNAFIQDFGVTTVFTPAAVAERKRIYSEIVQGSVSFHGILTGYLDESVVRRTARRAARIEGRPIDIGYRSWFMQPVYGSHGQLKPTIGRLFKERAPLYGLVVDISGDAADAFFGDAWFEFLLRCKYTIGVEGGCSVFDWDGSLARGVKKYVQAHPDAPFDEIAAACLAGADGGFEYFLLSPRHLEAAMTKTCQVLVSGQYSGVLVPGVHYIELERDWGNLDEVLQVIHEDRSRREIVDAAYRDIVESGDYTYRAFAELVFREVFGEQQRSAGGSDGVLTIWNRIDDATWSVSRRYWFLVRQTLKRIARTIVGEEMLRRLLSRIQRLH